MAIETAPKGAGAMSLYRWLDRSAWPRSYSQRVWLACNIVLVLVLAAWLAVAVETGTSLMVVAVAVVAGGLASGILYLVLRTALRPLQLSLEALRTYSEEARVPDLPAGYGGEAGLLMMRLHETLSELERMHGDLRRDAETDHLTGIGNRRWFFQRAAEEISRSRRSGGAFALILIDLDRFKQINDRFGHAAGDQVLRAISALVRRSLRGYDCFARLGGEEFAVLLPEADLAGALTAAERLRARIAALEIAALGGQRVTASFGVVQLEPGDDKVEQLLDRADRALYRAKESGRNRVMKSDEGLAARLRETARAGGQPPSPAGPGEAAAAVA